ncbi:MAG: replication protein RepA [Bryobacterales bacterium]|nr:replication protein RepA [Bryobacterales bacterium]
METIRFSKESRHQAQVRFGQAIESLQKQGDLTAGELDLLQAQRPVGIDDANQIVIEYATEAEAGNAAGPAFLKASWEVHRLGLAERLRQLVLETVRKRLRARSGRPRQRVLYMPSRLVSTTLPHRRVKGKEFVRTNGDMTMSLVATRKPGLPYGTYPRLALMHLTARAVLEGRRHLLIGESATDFLAALGINDSGGPRGSATRARAQVRRLASTAFTWESRSSRRSRDRWRGMLLADEWDRRPGAGMRVTLSAPFFDMARSSSVPLDAQIVQKLRRSPLALDVYAWLTWRVSTLRKETVIPWLALERQLGCDYRRPRQFRFEFRRRLRQITGLWPGVNAEPRLRGLLLRPSAPSVLSWLEHHTPHARRPPDE